MSNQADDRKKLIKVEANKAAAELDADLVILNSEVSPPIDFLFNDAMNRRRTRTNVVLFLTTEGGSADSAYRMLRCLQARYKTISVVVCGWCKSAGTLMCIGAHQLYIGPTGELGPLDVQIVKADEMDEQKSGLVAEAAFEKLQKESYKFFMSFVQDLGSSGYRVTLKTASDIAARMTVGVIQPIFDKLDPVTIGEDYRSNKLAQAYAERLNVHSKNLVRTSELDALENLLSSYPAHGFVIDAKEARTLFRNVDEIPGVLAALVDLQRADLTFPRSRRQGQGPRLEILNDDREEQSKDENAATESVADNRLRSARSRKGTRQLPRGTPKRGGESASAGSNGSTNAR